MRQGRNRADDSQRRGGDPDHLGRGQSSSELSKLVHLEDVDSG
jgi:hypothetical protein